MKNVALNLSNREGPAGIVMQRHHRQDFSLDSNSKTDDGKANRVNYFGAKLSRSYEEEQTFSAMMHAEVSPDDNPTRA